jgi:cytoskeleton protein RodZ
VVDGSGHRLNIQASSPTWVRIVVDDQPPKEMIIKAGESREWSGQQGFTLSLGNAGGVTLNLDGQDLPPVGKSGQVVRNIQLPANLSPSTNMTR